MKKQIDQADNQSAQLELEMITNDLSISSIDDYTIQVVKVPVSLSLLYYF